MTPGVWILLAGYYLLTPINALVDGSSWLLLIKVFTAQSLQPTTGLGLVDRTLNRIGLPLEGNLLIYSVIGLFFAKAVLVVTLTVLETRLTATVRRRIQEALFAKLLDGRWEQLRGGHVGRWTGALTEEASLFTKLLTSLVSALYAAITFLLLAAMAVDMAPRMGLLLIAVGIPAGLLLRSLYRVQTSLSSRQAQSRQGFASDITEALTGLFQIKASGDLAPALRRGLRRQQELQSRELQLGWTLGLLTAFNPLLLSLMLAAYSWRSRWQGASWASDMAAFSAVSVLAFRAASQLNILIAGIGNLTRLSGSVEPLHRLAVLPGEPARRPLPERLSRVTLEKLSYAYDGRTVLDGASLMAEPGKVLLITGPSGSGKTTLVNLIAGLYAPASGRVLYAGASGKNYNAADFRPRLGYVPQDVYLFSGTLRDNLDPLGVLSDDSLWRSLEAAGAAGFAKARGGLASAISEGGRSLSGGEKRRLAIASALAGDPDGLVLDEITNGLDESSKTALLQTVDALGRERLVVAISHDLAAFNGVAHHAFVLK